MPHSRGFNQRSRSNRRATEWGFGPGGTTPVTVSATQVQLVGSGVTQDLGGVTIVRTRGLLGLSLLSSAAAGEGFTGAFGIGVVATTAFVAGVASVPTPITEMDWEGWLYHEFFDVRLGLAAGSENAGVHRTIVDSKAMRKWEANEQTLFAALETSEQGTASVELTFNSRVLVKLP